MFESEKKTERLILVAIQNDDTGDADASLDELEALLNTAGGEAAGRLIQKRDGIHPKYYLGKGKLEELKMLISETGADGALCDDELTPAQLRHMEESLDAKILDRTMVILDIFANRASSAEGKVQVELAQLKYRLSHLTGLGKMLSRLGGGIGTRGPGEKKLETDRRHIRNRIAELSSELKEISQHQQVLREKRIRNSKPVVSMVGYTNAGKSTLLNQLTGAGVLAEDKLFATLDTVTKKVALPNGSDILYTDTVGFIQKLPHNLINSFRATLEELNYADILVHVVDASSPSADDQMRVVYDTLSDLKLIGKPIITVFNKIDKLTDISFPHDNFSTTQVRLSAVTGEGTNALLNAVEDILKQSRREIKALIPFSAGHLLNKIHETCEILEESHVESGTMVRLYATEEILNRLAGYLI